MPVPGDLVYYINDIDDLGEIGMYLGVMPLPHFEGSPAVHRILWTDNPNDTSQEVEESLMKYRQQYLDFRKKNG